MDYVPSLTNLFRNELEEIIGIIFDRLSIDKMYLFDSYSLPETKPHQYHNSNFANPNWFPSRFTFRIIMLKSIHSIIPP